MVYQVSLKRYILHKQQHKTHQDYFPGNVTTIVENPSLQIVFVNISRTFFEKTKFPPQN